MRQAHEDMLGGACLHVLHDGGGTNNCHCRILRYIILQHWGLSVSFAVAVAAASALLCGISARTATNHMAQQLKRTPVTDG